eukprot:m.354156 g.354156  ORF g.354156 m.354156 type:complete len:62 (-) comp16940_c0_seq1:669-854(-)
MQASPHKLTIHSTLYDDSVQTRTGVSVVIVMFGVSIFHAHSVFGLGFMYVSPRVEHGASQG